jgi:hypothetical protein
MLSNTDLETQNRQAQAQWILSIQNEPHWSIDAMITPRALYDLMAGIVVHVHSPLGEAAAMAMSRTISARQLRLMTGMADLIRRIIVATDGCRGMIAHKALVSIVETRI